MAFKPANVSLSKIRKVLEQQGCKKIRHAKGHEKYSRNDLLRPIVIQDHIDPVPQFIGKQIMRILSLSSEEMEQILKEI